MTPLRVGLLANPTARMGKAGESIHSVKTWLEVAGVHVVDVSGPSAAIARQRALEVIDTLRALIVVGGDGTVSLGASIVEGTEVALGVVPLGSGNDFARALGIPLDDPHSAVRACVRALADGPRAFDALVNERANTSRLGYTAAVFRELVNFRAREYTIQVDDQPEYSGRFSLVSVCNSGIFGSGMRYSPSSLPSDGSVELVTVGPMSRLSLVRFFPKVFRGTHIRVPHLTVTRARSVTVGLPHHTDVTPYADGERAPGFPLRITVAPGAVLMLAP